MTPNAVATSAVPEYQTMDSAPIANRLIEQLCKDLNGAHDEIVHLQGVARSDAGQYDWPEWTPQANSIRWAEKLLGKRLAKTNLWTMFPDVAIDRARTQGGDRG